MTKTWLLALVAAVGLGSMALGQDTKQETQPDVEARMTEPETGSGPEARSPETRSVPQALWPERHAIVVATVPDGAEPDQDRGAEQDASWIVVQDLEAGS